MNYNNYKLYIIRILRRIYYFWLVIRNPVTSNVWHAKNRKRKKETSTVIIIITYINNPIVSIVGESTAVTAVTAISPRGDVIGMQNIPNFLYIIIYFRHIRVKIMIITTDLNYYCKIRSIHIMLRVYYNLLLFLIIIICYTVKVYFWYRQLDMLFVIFLFSKGARVKFYSLIFSSILWKGINDTFRSQTRALCRIIVRACCSITRHLDGTYNIIFTVNPQFCSVNNIYDTYRTSSSIPRWRWNESVNPRNKPFLNSFD